MCNYESRQSMDGCPPEPHGEGEHACRCRGTIHRDPPCEFVRTARVFSFVLRLPPRVEEISRAARPNQRATASRGSQYEQVKADSFTQSALRSGQAISSTPKTCTGTCVTHHRKVPLSLRCDLPDDKIYGIQLRWPEEVAALHCSRKLHRVATMKLSSLLQEGFRDGSHAD